MQHKSPTVDDVIAALEHFRAGTGMYIYPVDVPHTRSFLVGFVVGLRAGGIAIEGELRSQVQRDRGRKSVRSDQSRRWKKKE